MRWIESHAVFDYKDAYLSHTRDEVKFRDYVSDLNDNFLYELYAHLNTLRKDLETKPWLGLPAFGRMFICMEHKTYRIILHTTELFKCVYGQGSYNSLFSARDLEIQTNLR